MNYPFHFRALTTRPSSLPNALKRAREKIGKQTATLQSVEYFLISGERTLEKCGSNPSVSHQAFNYHRPVVVEFPLQKSTYSHWSAKQTNKGKKGLGAERTYIIARSCGLFLARRSAKFAPEREKEREVWPRAFIRARVLCDELMQRSDRTAARDRKLQGVRGHFHSRGNQEADLLARLSSARSLYSLRALHLCERRPAHRTSLGTIYPRLARTARPSAQNLERPISDADFSLSRERMYLCAYNGGLLGRMRRTYRAWILLSRARRCLLTRKYGKKTEWWFSGISSESCAVSGNARISACKWVLYKETNSSGRGNFEFTVKSVIKIIMTHTVMVIECYIMDMCFQNLHYCE